MPTKSDVRDMMLDPSKIKIPSTPAQQVAFAENVVSNLWDAKCPVEQNLLVRWFYKIMTHKDVCQSDDYLRIQFQTTILINLAERLLYSGEDDDIRLFYRLILNKVVDAWAVSRAVQYIFFEMPDYFKNKGVVLERMSVIDGSEPFVALMNMCR